MKTKEWRVFTGKGKSVENSKRYEEVRKLAPPWRDYAKGPSILDKYRADSFVLDMEDEDDEKTINLINAALYLQKPILVKGPAGVGKSSLAYAIASQLSLGNVIVWPITSHSTIKDALYKYEILRHLAAITTKPVGSDNKKVEVGEFFTLKQLGAALVATNGDKPRVLLIDEIDKADMDLPNDLLHVLEYGRFKIDEWMQENQNFKVRNFEDNLLIKDAVDKGGWVNAKKYPVIIMTSNGEREFSAPFLRRCITIELKLPSKEKLEKIVRRHYEGWVLDKPNGHELLDSAIEKLIGEFHERSSQNSNVGLPTDKLLSAVHLFLNNMENDPDSPLMQTILGND